MALMDELPADVVDLLRMTSFAEFATISSEGVPIDTPLLSFPEPDLSTIAMATGLAYPVKAERARRNPKVGLLFYPRRAGEPVVQIIGRAAVRDSDIQGNLLRYLSETGYVAPEVPWALRRQAVWYWARILIEIRPVEICWWAGVHALDRPPQVWRAPDSTHYPASDPAPAGRSTAAPKWQQPEWQAAARSNIAAGYPACVTLVDEEGYPRIMHARAPRLCDTGLVFTLPDGAPGPRAGKASLTYFGRDTFIGEIARGTDGLHLNVERTLPVLPMVANPDNTWNPPAALKTSLMERLTGELARRGQALPTVPEHPPELTEGAKLRALGDRNGADEALFEGSAR